MKNICLLLVKNRLIQQLGVNEIRFSTGKKKRQKLLLLTLVLLLIPLVMIYAGGFAYGLSYLGIGEIIPTYAFLLGSIVSLLFTTFKATGELFVYKDFDFLMSVPITTQTIIASRFLTLYVWNTAISLVIMAPMGVVYCIFEKPEFIFYPLWLVGALLACFIPTTIAVVIGSLIALISSKFKSSRKVNIVLELALLVAVLLFPTLSMNGNLTTDTGDLNREYVSRMLLSGYERLCTLYPVAHLFKNAIVLHKISSLCLFILLSIGWYVIFVAILSRRYRKINTALSTFRTASNYVIGVMKQNSVHAALYKKEIRRWVGSPVYFTNTITGVVMAVLITVALAIVGPSGISKATGGSLNPDVVNYGFAYMIAACIGMCCTTMASISLEGKCVWLLQSLPIEMRSIVRSKLLVNLTVTIPSAILCATLFVFSIDPGVAGGVLVFLIPIAFSLFSAVFGLWLNLKMHTYSWENETQVVKQNLTSFIGLLLSPVVSLLFLGLALLTKANPVVVGSVTVALVLTATWILFRSVTKSYPTIPD
jgi:ABC-2 type transport system permease protein